VTNLIASKILKKLCSFDTILIYFNML